LESLSNLISIAQDHYRATLAVRSGLAKLGEVELRTRVEFELAISSGIRASGKRRKSQQTGALAMSLYKRDNIWWIDFTIASG
jgi:hypothetical protein